MSDANYDVEGLYDGDEENCFDEALMEELWERRTEMTEMKAQIKQLTKERDEARRMYCSMVENNARQYGTSAQSVAKQAGWGCFNG